MAKNIEKSIRLFEESKCIMPGGVNSPVRAFKAVGGTPRFIEKAKGSHIVDCDGNDYIDYVCSWGPGILGHASEKVIEKVKEACEDGLTFGAPTKKELILAKLIKECMPSMEMIRFVSSGTEAAMSAIRVARGYTNRDKIIKFSGCYHGHSDGLLVSAGSGIMTSAVSDSAGVPADYIKNTLVAGYNDEKSVTNLFEFYGNQIAAVIVEPVAANMGVVPPRLGFLSFLRDITKRYGSLLIFDEVITGFRLGIGGAQEKYGMTPDLTCLGKIVGGGMPIGAYGGKSDIMKKISPEGRVYQAGTLSGNPIATTAGIETISILMSHQEIYNEIDEKAKKIADTVRKAAKGRVQVNQVGSLLSVFFTNIPVTDYVSAKKSNVSQYAAYFHYLLERGIYTAPSQFEAMFLSSAHLKEDIEKTCECITNYFAE